MGTCARNLVLIGDPLQLATSFRERTLTAPGHPCSRTCSVSTHDPAGPRPVPRAHLPPAPRRLRATSPRRSTRADCTLTREPRGAPRRSGPGCATSRSSQRQPPILGTGGRRRRRRGCTAPRSRGRRRRRDGRPPFNAHVDLLRQRLPEEVRVGTVDKFQGQEARVVIYSMASSSGEEVPHGLDFLLSRNRLNVAISRAQSLAYLVCAPALLEVDCKTIEHMRLANALCRFVEIANEQEQAPRP